MPLILDGDKVTILSGISTDRVVLEPTSNPDKLFLETYCPNRQVTMVATEELLMAIDRLDPDAIQRYIENK